MQITTDAPEVRAPLAPLPRPRPAPAEAALYRYDRLRPGTRALLLVFVVFTLLAVNQLLVLGGRTDRFFAWPIPSRPNSTFLGAAYAAGTVLSVLALRAARWSHVRIAVATVTWFTALTLVPTLLHRHVLNVMAQDVVARAAAWVWLAVYLAVPVVGTLVVVRQNRGAEGGPQVVRRPLPRPLVVVLLAQGAALAAIGTGLYAGGFRSHVSVGVMRAGWPWPVTPLTSQVIGAWLLSFGIAVVLAVRERNLSRMFVPAVAYAVFGAVEVAVLVLHRGAAGTQPLWLWADVALFATLVPVGAYGAWAAGRNTRSASSSSPCTSSEATSRPTAAASVTAECITAR